MQVEIGNSGYRISTDPHNYILEEKRIAGEKLRNRGRFSGIKLVTIHPLKVR